MVQTTVSSSPRGRQAVEGQLLQDLEALNQALYFAGQSKGDGIVVVRRETVESDRSEELIRSPQASIRGAGGYSLDMGLMAEIPKERNESPRGRSKNSSVASSIRGNKDNNVDVRKKLEASAEKKKGMWGWKPFQSIAHVGQKKYSCLFTVHVHGIEGLPASMNGLRLAVCFSKRDDAGVQTTPVRVFQGHAEFQETLSTKGSVHGSKNGPKGMKWESKLFTLSVIAPEADELMLGKHKLDLTRLLPETMEDDDDDNKRGSWTTSFKLSGKAQAATLVVTFGCEFQREDSRSSSTTASSMFGESPVLRGSRSFSSSPNSGHASPSRYTSEGYHSPSSSEHRADHHGMERLNLDAKEVSPRAKKNVPTQAKAVERQAIHDQDSRSAMYASRAIDDEREVEELLAALGGKANAFDKSEDMTEEELLSLLPGGGESCPRESPMKAPVPDDEHVEGEFLSFLASDSRPLPVRPNPGREQATSRSEVPDFSLDGVSTRRTPGPKPTKISLNIRPSKNNNSDWGDEEVVQLDSIVEAAESELNKATQTIRSKNKAKMLEDAETEALMQEWGLNKKSFEGSRRTSLTSDTNNAYALVSYDPPPLGYGLGPEVPTRGGGSLRTMSPLNFQDTSGSNLVMQVSKPVVVPMDSGANSLAVLQRMAAVGIDGMTHQAMLTMPLDDITGKSVEQIASEGLVSFQGTRQGQEQIGYASSDGVRTRLSLEYTSDTQRNYGGSSTYSLSKTPGRRASLGGPPPSARRRSSSVQSEDTYMSLEDLAPMAMQKLEPLTLDGLKIQLDMADEEAPYAVQPRPWKERSSIDGYSRTQRSRKSLDDTAHKRLAEGGGADSSGALDDDDFSMAISLDEWMRLDAGVVEEDDNSAMALVAAHHAAHGDIVPSQQKNRNQGIGDGSDDTNGLMGSTITLAMLVQLRDPLRNFEPVGAPMMALVQAERVVVPPMPKLKFGRRVSLTGNHEGFDEEESRPKKPSFKIKEITISGLKVSEEPSSDNKKEVEWGTPKQLQSGSRWLLASGIAKGSKISFLKSKTIMSSSDATSTSGASNALAVPAPTKSSSSSSIKDSLWSISAKLGNRWGAPSAPKVRNPDVAMTKSSWFSKKK